MATIDSLITEEPQKNIKKNRPIKKEKNLKTKLLLCAALWIFAHSPCTSFYVPVEPKPVIESRMHSIIEKEKIDKIRPKFEFKYSPSLPENPNSRAFIQINYSKGEDSYLQILIDLSKPENKTSLDSLLYNTQVFIKKPAFGIRHNKKSQLDENNKIVYRECWTVINMEGDRISKLEYKYSPSVLGNPNSRAFIQINYSKGEDSYLQILMDLSKPENKTSLDSLLYNTQVFIKKPDFEIRHNKKSQIDENDKIVYCEFWHINGKINGDQVTLTDMDGDGNLGVLFHNRKNSDREVIILDSKVDKNNIFFDEKEFSKENKDLIMGAYNLFYNCLKYFNKEVYKTDGDSFQIIF